MKYTFSYAMIGGFSGALYYFVKCIQAGGLDLGNMLLCFGLGIVGGFVPGIVRETSRRHILFFQSWTMLIILIYGMPFFTEYITNPQKMHLPLYWIAVIYGYMGHLLWEAYRGQLPRL